MQANESVVTAAGSVQRAVMSVPTATIEEAVAEARRRPQAVPARVAGRVPPRLLVGTAQAA